MHRRDFLKMVGLASLSTTLAPEALANASEEEIINAGRNVVYDLHVGDLVCIKVEGTYPSEGSFMVTAINKGEESTDFELEETISNSINMLESSDTSMIKRSCSFTVNNEEPI